MTQQRVEEDAVCDGAARAVLRVYRVSDRLLQIPVTICHMDVSCAAHSLRERGAGLDDSFATMQADGPCVGWKEGRVAGGRWMIDGSRGSRRLFFRH